MKQRFAFILATFVAWLPVFAVQKPLFMLYHHSLANGCSPADYLQVILHGLKLDATLAGYLTAIPLLLTFVSVWKPGEWLKRTLKGYFLLTALLVALIFVVDEGLYTYWRFRLDATLFFYLRSPKDAMASVPATEFLLQSFTFLLYGGAVFYFFKRVLLPFTPVRPVRRKWTGSVGMLLAGGVLFIPIRGGVTTSTANVGMVYFSNRQFLNHSAINPCFSLVASLSKQQDFAAQFDFFPEAKRKALFETLVRPAASGESKNRMNEADTGKHVRESGNRQKMVDAGNKMAGTVTKTADNSGASPRMLTTDRPNILIILLESFSANVVEALGGEPGVTPHLDRLSQEGVLFTNVYANSFRTDRGIVAVLNGYPAQPTTSIMKYPAKSQSLPSLARSLAKEGYKADMLYGGDINFTNMQSYFFSSGYERITADRDFPLKSRLSKWGVNDDLTFDHLYRDLREREDSPQRWLTTFLTLSSHEPFEVPYRRLAHPYLNSVAFADSCLGDFIDRLKTTAVWKDLLVVLVADHGYRYPDDLTDPDPRRYHIPMLWLGGAVATPQVIETYTGQIDLAATLLAQLNLPHEDFLFSKNVLDPNLPHYAFYTYPNAFGFIDTTGVTVFDNESMSVISAEPDSSSSLREEKGKALLQTLYDDLGSR